MTSPFPAPAAHPLPFRKERGISFISGSHFHRARWFMNVKKGEIAQMCKSERTRECREGRLIDVKTSVVFL